MENNNNKPIIPELDSLRTELARVNRQSQYRYLIRTAACVLVVVIAAVSIAAAQLPIFQIYGTSMKPTLNERDIVIAVRGSELHQGDLAAFYVGNRILVKRCIARSGQWIDIDSRGVVYVDNEPLTEPYIAEESLGECNITLPYQVPESHWFCLGDNRAASIDSRHTSVGCVGEEQVIGKIIFRLWPLNRIGGV